MCTLYNIRTVYVDCRSCHAKKKRMVGCAYGTTTTRPHVKEKEAEIGLLCIDKSSAAHFNFHIDYTQAQQLSSSINIACEILEGYGFPIFIAFH